MSEIMTRQVYENLRNLAKGAEIRKYASTKPDQLGVIKYRMFDHLGWDIGAIQPRSFAAMHDPRWIVETKAEDGITIYKISVAGTEAINDTNDTYDTSFVKCRCGMMVKIPKLKIIKG